MKPISITGTACKEAIRNAVCLNFIFHYIISLLRNALPINKIGARLPFTITNNKHKFHSSPKQNLYKFNIFIISDDWITISETMGHNRKDAGIFFPVDFRSVPKARAVTVTCQPEIMPRLCFKAGKVYVTSRGDKHKIMTVPHNAAAAFSGQIIDVAMSV